MHINERDPPDLSQLILGAELYKTV